MRTREGEDCFCSVFHKLLIPNKFTEKQGNQWKKAENIGSILQKYMETQHLQDFLAYIYTDNFVFFLELKLP